MTQENIIQQIFRQHRAYPFVILLGVVSYLSLTPSPAASLASIWDKWQHLIAWGFINLTLQLIKSARRRWLSASVGLFAYSVCLEVLQYWIPNRHFSWLDLLANALGIALAAALVIALIEFYPRVRTKSID